MTCHVKEESTRQLARKQWIHRWPLVGLCYRDSQGQAVEVVTYDWVSTRDRIRLTQSGKRVRFRSSMEVSAASLLHQMYSAYDFVVLGHVDLSSLKDPTHSPAPGEYVRRMYVKSKLRHPFRHITGVSNDLFFYGFDNCLEARCPAQAYTSAV